MSFYHFTILDARSHNLTFEAYKDGRKIHPNNIQTNDRLIKDKNFNAFSIIVLDKTSEILRKNYAGKSVSQFGLSTNGLTGETVETSTFNLFPLFQPGDCLFIENIDEVHTTHLSVLKQVKPNTGTIQSSILFSPGEISFIFFADGVIPVFSNKSNCVHPDTMVKTPNGEKAIKTLRKGDLVIDVKNKIIPLSFNIKSAMSKNFVHIPKNSLENNVPNQDLIIKREHPLLYKGKEITAAKLVKRLEDQGVSNIVLKKPAHVWSLCTKDRAFVMMNNVPICTWGENCWAKFIEDNADVHHIKY